MDIPEDIRGRLLERLRRHRSELEGRIAFLESGSAQVRILHEGEWVEATATTLTNLYRQYGDLGSLISDISSGRI